MAKPGRPVQLALLWHLHQPDYAPVPDGGPLLPWTRLHALRNYGDLIDVLGRHPAVRSTLDLDAVLLERFVSYEDGSARPDPFLRAARRDPADLTFEERRFVVTAFLDVRRAVLARDLPRLHELAARRGQYGAKVVPDSVVARFGNDDLRDLQMLFHLAWCGSLLRADDRVQGWIERGRSYTEDDKHALLDLQAVFLAGLAGRLRALASAGHVELSTGPYYHPAMPLVCDVESAHESDPKLRLPAHEFAHPEDVLTQLDAARDRFQGTFGHGPVGGWSPEGAISEASLAALRTGGWAWTASDEAVLFRSIGERASERGRRRSRTLHRVWRAEDGPVVLFRDAGLSKVIAEEYGIWNPDLAAADFVHRVQRIRREAAEDAAVRTVTVTIDGENAWDDHPGGCVAFLDALFSRLEVASSDIVTIRADEAAVGTSDAPLAGVISGSWVDGGLDTWVGSPAANRAWDLLAETRAAVAADRGQPRVTDDAWRAVLAAESSDWFRWFGARAPVPFAADLDVCFRGHLIRAWNEIGREPPEQLAEPLLGHEEERFCAPAGPIRPVLAGRVTDWFEWLAAGRVDATEGLVGATAVPVRSLHFGGDGAYLYLRLDPWEAPVSAGLAGALVRICFPGWPDRTLTAVAPGSGASASGGVRLAADQVLEIAVPVARLPGDGDVFRFHVLIETGAGARQRLPDAGALSIPVGDRQEPEWEWHV